MLKCCKTFPIPPILFALAQLTFPITMESADNPPAKLTVEKYMRGNCKKPLVYWLFA